ncbi:glycosyltransferase, partial [Lactobacillus delbrueckii]|uniref:glycosyltransferase n=1 Tax=Lactobacillus delbrueckii TaxID=1584 RepID=UPI003C12C4D7
MICHGGNGSLYQALQAGIPILCHPSNFEQEWNLQGLEKSGCGERLSLNPTQRVQQIQHWMTRKGTDSSNHLSRLV